jgi:hypothetical protein
MLRGAEIAFALPAYACRTPKNWRIHLVVEQWLKKRQIREFTVE